MKNACILTLLLSTYSVFASDNPVLGHWTTMGGTLPGTNGSVQKLAVAQDGSLWVAGAFDRAGSTVAPVVARWDDGKWQGTGIPIEYWTYWDMPNITVFKFDPKGRLVMGGSHDDGVGDHLFLSRLDSTWTRLEDSRYPRHLGCKSFPRTDCQIDALEFLTSGNLLVAGKFSFETDTVVRYQIAEWNDTAWAPWKSPGTDTIRGLARDSSGGILAWGTAGLRRWKEGAWSWVGMDSAQAARVRIRNLVVEATGKILVEGSLDGLGIGWRMARNSGGIWEEFGRTDKDSLEAGDVIRQVVSTATGTLAIGEFHRAGMVLPALRWIGTGWSAVMEGIRAASTPLIHDQYVKTISAAAAQLPDGSLVLGGQFDFVGSFATLNLARWKEGAVSSFGQGLVGTIRAVLPDEAGGWVVGGDGFTSGSNRLIGSGLARLSGSGTWSGWPGSVDGWVSSLLPAKEGGFYAAGEFRRIGTDSFSNVARWNGKSWQRMGEGFDGKVVCLRKDSKGVLYAAGKFLHSGKVAVDGLARWNGSTWESVMLNPQGYKPKFNYIDEIIPFSDGSVLMVYHKEQLSPDAKTFESYPEAVQNLAYRLRSSILSFSYRSANLYRAVVDDSDRVLATGAFEGYQSTFGWIRCDSSRCLGKSHGTSYVLLADPSAPEGFFSTLSADVYRWRDTSANRYTGLNGMIAGMVADGDSAMVVWGDLTGASGSSLVRLSNPREAGLAVKVRESRMAGPFRGAGASLETVLAGRLEVFDPAGRKLRDQLVPAGYRLARLDLPKGLYLVRMSGQTIPFVP
jgi:hypothetical protein